jgi:hypothetical protein
VVWQEKQTELSLDKRAHVVARDGESDARSDYGEQRVELKDGLTPAKRWGAPRQEIESA